MLAAAGRIGVELLNAVVPGVGDPEIAVLIECAAADVIEFAVLCAMPADRPQIRAVPGKDLHVVTSGVDDVDGVLLPEVDQDRHRLEKLPLTRATAPPGPDEVPLGIELLDARIL